MADTEALANRLAECAEKQDFEGAFKLVRENQGELAKSLQPEGIKDALNGVWYKDDSQVVEYGKVGKWYAEEPRVYVRLDREVDDGQE